MLRCAFLFLLIGLIACAACTATPPDTLSNEVVTLAQTEQADAPALAWNGGLIAAWIGSDARGVHQDARRLTSAGMSATVTLPLPPTHPYGQGLFPGVDGNTHLLWLDADSDNVTNLYSALITPDLVVERGPIPISEGLALRYAASPDGSGGLWTVWSGGLLAEMNIYARQIDNEGRPLQTAIIATNGSDPALARTMDGAVWLFWLADGQLMRARLDPAGETQAISGAVSLAPGDRADRCARRCRYDRVPTTSGTSRGRMARTKRGLHRDR